MLHPAQKPACSSAMIFSTCGFSVFIMIFSLALLGWLMRLIGRCFWHCCRLPFLGSVMIRDWVHGTGHFPICQILLQIVVTPVSTSSPPAWTGSTGMLSTPADFPFFNDCIAAFIFYFFYFFCEGWGGRPLCMSGNSSVLMVLHWPCGYTAESSILSIGSESVALL